MNVANGRGRCSHDFRDNIIGHVNSAGLCWVRLDRFNVQRRSHQPTVAQGDLSDAVTDAGNLHFGTPPDLKRKRPNISQVHDIHLLLRRCINSDTCRLVPATGTIPARTRLIPILLNFLLNWAFYLCVSGDAKSRFEESDNATDRVGRHWIGVRKVETVRLAGIGDQFGLRANRLGDQRGNALTGILLVPVERIELPTFGLQNRCSTAELNRHRAKS